MSAIAQSQKFKELGNDAFLKSDYKSALQHYSSAIICDSQNSILFSNRARAYKQLLQYQEAYQDAQKAIELDNNNIKAHLISGQILAQMGKSEKGIKQINKAIQDMTKALTLCAGQNKQVFEKDLNKYILRAKKLLYFKNIEIEQENIKKEIDYLKTLLNQQNMNQKQANEIIQKAEECYQKNAKKIKNEVPDHLCCPITMNLYEDPVITQYGFSYERQALLEHFKLNGDIDPIARKPINRNIPLISNLSLKKVVSEFLQNEPWAYEHYLDQNSIEKIEF
ncbi:U-box protein (macronuclear) [Tetrahymena thermophila SB210]|uniref:RING-type E3 ubiquitin transferase n=1 Tax=Tetrahymena thermophila (strain SB210) TaxID=312017 RepID=Q22D39_TETTS|nr:U-box protein [Tetrahymena thermophila SB210]EAR83214.3 U-box protein [Tetrahymena thermophila SB210]|eukprot:XP_001030877.3 U-box protein [Tetrahymena thermophila SB210]